jgi:hypothetical protein
MSLEIAPAASRGNRRAVRPAQPPSGLPQSGRSRRAGGAAERAGG